MNLTLSPRTMYNALVRRDESYEGIFLVGVKTTGIFCRPSCRARKPKKDNVEFFHSTKDALLQGYRPCKVCAPMTTKGASPEWVRKVLHEAMNRSDHRMNDVSIRKLGVDPNRLRRWFKENHGMTFQGYLRSIRLGRAFGHLANGNKVIDTAFDHGYDSLSGFTNAFKKTLGSRPSKSSPKTVIYVSRLLTPLGPMVAASVEKGVCLLEFADRRALESELKEINRRLDAPLLTSPGPHIEELKKQLKEYFSGERREFTIPLITPGTDFQNQVWQGLRQIPYGTTRSYKEQATAIGRPSAVRAVATANGHNRIAIIIPCHRVIGANGTLVGYGGGLWRKQRLLAIENGVPIS